MHHRIKGYRCLMIPSQNKWALDLLLEAPSPRESPPYPDLIEFSTAAELAAVVDILRHTQEATFDPDYGQIITRDATPGK